jgi:autotransporter-associated beta strand protein
MGRTTTFRQLAVAAAIAFSPIAASAADCTAGDWATVVSCAASLTGAADTITLTADVAPDGTQVNVAAGVNIALINNGFGFTGASVFRKGGPGAFVLPAANAAFTGQTQVGGGALGIGDPLSTGNGAIILGGGGGLLGITNTAVGVGLIIVAGPATIAAAPGFTFQVFNLALVAGGSLTVGDPANNGTVSFGAVGGVDATSPVVLNGGTFLAGDLSASNLFVNSAGTTMTATGTIAAAPAITLTLDKLTLGPGVTATLADPVNNGVVGISNAGVANATSAAVIAGSVGAFDATASNIFSNTATTTFTGSGILDTNGQTVVIANVAGSGQVLNASPGAVAFHTGTYDGVISGDGNVGKDTTGILVFTGTNTYTGPTLIVDGELQIGNGGSTGTLGNTSGVNLIAPTSALVYIRDNPYELAATVSGPGNLAVNHPSGTLYLSGNNTYTGATIVAQGNLGIGFGGTSGTLGNTSGVLNNGAIGYNRTDAYTLSAPIAGTGTVAVVNSGTLTLSSPANSYTGATFVNSPGTLAVTGSIQTSAVASIDGGGTLQGTGTTGAVNVNVGTVGPGLSPGILNTGSISLTPASTVAIEIAGNTAGTGYDQINVTGTVALNGAALATSGAYVPVLGDSFVLINNDGADAVTGTFAGIPEGTTASFNGTLLRLSYAGGDGNDVVLSVVTYTVTPSIAGAPDGTIAPNTPQAVLSGGTANFTVTPNVGFTASVGGTCGPAAGPSATPINYTTNAVTADCTVVATFTQITYTVTPSAGANGSIAPNTPQTVNHGATANFTVTPNVGFTASVGGTCGPAAGPSATPINYTTNAVTADCTVVATFTQITYTVTPSAGANGTIAPNTPQTVNHGSTIGFTVTPSAGYTASVGGTCPAGTLVGNSYTTGAITADCTVVATFSQITFTVTPSAGANGTIAPNTPQTVAQGGNISFTVTANAGYTAVVGGTCGGNLVGNTYTTNAITANCTVDATFTQNTYTVTPSAGANGTIAPNTPQTVAHGATTTFTVTPNAGYTAVVGGTCGGNLVGNTYTTNAITANCTVSATFTQNTYTVTPSAGANGTISPNTPQTVAHGATTTFTVTPNAGFTATVGGTCGGTLVGNTYTTNAITANCTVAATFSNVPVTTHSGASPTGTGTITATMTGGGPTCGFGTREFIPVTGHPSSPPAGTAPAGVAFPHGLFNFTTTGCTPGSTVTITVTYPSAMAAGAQYYKYGPEPSNATPHWYVLPATVTATTAIFSITDGGQGDDDLAANGTIVDQGGPGVPGGGPGTIDTPTMTEWGLIIMSLLMLLTGMGGFRRRALRGR